MCSTKHSLAAATQVAEDLGDEPTSVLPHPQLPLLVLLITLMFLGKEHNLDKVYSEYHT